LTSAQILCPRKFTSLHAIYQLETVNSKLQTGTTLLYIYEKNNKIKLIKQAGKEYAFHR
jgi:hypothetical protein